jgi:hypothetical protein
MANNMDATAWSDVFVEKSTKPYEKSHMRPGHFQIQEKYKTGGRSFGRPDPGRHLPL